MNKKNHNVQWEIHIGFYPGILVGVLRRRMQDHDDHVLYLPLMDICLTVYRK